MAAWWWLSFADDQRCRGVAIVRGEDIQSAAARAKELGIHPGGEVLGFPIPPSGMLATVGRYGTDRLIPVQELIEGGERPLKDRSPEQQGMAASLPFLCEEHGS